ncbi:MAG: hypothetical protein M3O50_08890, partial [Myxococcota bacterium]|nr:hypothetical protein [Myxococcota bacterium]
MMRLTLRAKLVTIVALTAVAFLLLIVASALIANRVERRLGIIQARYVPKVELKPQLDGAFDNLRRSFQDAVGAHDLDALAATGELKKSFVERLGAAHDVVASEDAAALRAALDDYYASAYDVSSRLIANETGEPLVDVLAAMQRKQLRFTELLQRTTAFDRRELTDAFAAVKQAEYSAKMYRLEISVGCLIAVMLLTMWLGQGVLRSFADLTSGFRRFGKGDFGQPIRVATRDALGDVARHANQMATDLERLTRERLRAEEALKVANRELEVYGHSATLEARSEHAARELAEKALRQSEEQLRQAQKMEAVGRLAGGVAHDFNNVLSVILSYGELILSGLRPADPRRADIQEIMKAGQRAAGLTRQLLLFSRQQVVEPKVIDLNEVLSSMDKMLQRIVGEDVELVSLTSKAIGRVSMDPSHVEQVILNLVVNARDAMPTGGKLMIETANVDLDDDYARGHLPAK